MLIEFDDTLVTGNDTIDTQHKELIGRISSFVTACEQRDSKVTALKMLDYLDEYTKFHFADEEKLQEEVSYPELKNHHEKHEEFKKTIDTLYEYLDELDGPTDEFTNTVKEKVVEWLFNHIKTYDRSVAEYIFLQDNPDIL